MQAGLIESYVLKKDFGSVAVYQRATAKDSRRVNLGWGDRKERWAQGQALDAIGAFRYMADVHQSRGEVAEASRLMGLVKEVECGVRSTIGTCFGLVDTRGCRWCAKDDLTD